ncbi:MAG TPA: Hsp70 family protein [Jiangellaceae bacterium]|nr:Hsp70 family protein [Jiangellaceae bacterium]
MYTLGIDLGTTYTAAATWRDGRVEIASLGSRGAAIPSVVLLRSDETFLTGEPANRRALTEPDRVAREFKRRLGDPTPLLLGGVPYAAEALMARLLRWVVDEVSTREGSDPESICVCHPANWGPYKLDLLQQAVRMSNLDQPVSFTTEPEAAATFYAQGRPVPAGALVAVYDLGGGTFDAAVLRKTESGFEILGQPEGIERLGGIDFDAAVFNHVNRAIGDKLDELDEGDPAAVAAVARLREECIEAKEALSTDTDVSIPVLLPNLSTEVRLTRAELEAMVRPVLYESIGALRRALRSANVTPEQLNAVLLVGGSSRMPIVSQLVGAELGRPVAVDAHPKHAIALGAAWVASGLSAAPPAAARAGAGAAPPEVGGGVPPAAAAVAGPVAFAASPGPGATPSAVEEGRLAGVGTGPEHLAPEPTTPISEHRVSQPQPVYDESPVERTMMFPAAGTEASSRAGEATPAGPAGPSHGQPAPVPRPDEPSRRSRTPIMILGGVILAAAIGLGGWALNQSDGDPNGQADQDLVAGQLNPDPTDEAEEEAPAEDDAPVDEEPQLPADEQCTEAIMSNERWVCITSATISDGQLVIDYDAEWAGSTPDIDGGFHVHFYGADDTGTEPPAHVMGSHAASSDRGDWYIEDQNPSIHPLDSNQVAALGGAPKVCARIADGDHALVPDADGEFVTGNCWPIAEG